MYSGRSDCGKGRRIRLPIGLFAGCTRRRASAQTQTGWRYALIAMIVALGTARVLAQCTEEQKLTASDAAPGDSFGRVVSVNGDTAVVGAVLDSCAAGPGCGAAYVFRFNGTSWIQEQKLTASDAGAGDLFGGAVSVSGNTVVVGADRDSCAAGILCGAAYVFRFNGTSWVQEQKLTASNAAAGDLFGVSVSVIADTVVVGAQTDDCAGVLHSNCGAAYVFRFNGTSWVQQQKLTASDAEQNDFFGGSVSVSGNTAVMGAIFDSCAAGDHCGAAYVFRSNGTSWVQMQKLTASDAEQNDFFGGSVSVSGDTVIVGATGDGCAAGSGCGAAYVFRFNGTSWVQEQKLTASDAAAIDLFGSSVSVSGDTSVVGAFLDDCAAGSDCGSASLFRFNGTSWVQEQKLTASDAGAGDSFGFSVSVSGETAVAGAFGDNCAASVACGAAYVFRCPISGPIPAASTWGLMSLTLLLLVIGKIVFRRSVSSSGSEAHSIKTGT